MGSTINKLLGGNDAAKKAQERAAAEQARQERLMRNQATMDQQNQAKQVTQVEAGGSDMPGTLLEDIRRRKRSTEMATQLGVV